MKFFSLVLLSALCLLLQPAARAQEASPVFKEEATTTTRKLAAFIALDDARQLPVRRLTQLRLTQEAEARQLYTNDSDMLQKKLTAIGQDYTAQLGTLLSAAQYERYLAAAPGALPASVAAIRMPEPVALAQAPAAAASAAAAPRRPAAKPSPARTIAPARPTAPKGASVRR